MFNFLHLPVEVQRLIFSQMNDEQFKQVHESFVDCDSPCSTTSYLWSLRWFKFFANNQPDCSILFNLVSLKLKDGKIYLDVSEASSLLTGEPIYVEWKFIQKFLRGRKFAIGYLEIIDFDVSMADILLETFSPAFCSIKQIAGCDLSKFINLPN